ncbi:glucokinase [Beijerinckia mobilis]|uniref:glucokinase n=1 Tax=Beijerinckia mobilis TaxID=231434 RepID=UPI000558716B|nr:glucokinase [Beijerinckia mobilis]
MHFPFPHLLADIGGTHVRFALAAKPGTAVEPILSSRTAAFADFSEALASVLSQSPVIPRSLIVCAAGPVAGRRIAMTNAPWTIDGPAIASHFGLEQGLLLNDFEAQAYSLSVLKEELVHPIGSQTERQAGAQIILGPGTGLGVAALVSLRKGYYALMSEAGHVDLGPADTEEAALWPYIDPGPTGRISAETLLSGAGLMRLHRARLARCGRAIVEPDSAGFDPGAIGHLIEAAHRDSFGEEAATVALFFTLLARFSSDMAVTFVAHGGVTFAGGILPRMIDLLDVERFRARFEDKAPHRHWVQAIPTRLILDEAALLAGLAAIAASPDSYFIDYAHRAWR